MNVSTYRDTDSLIEAMRLAGWSCRIEVRPDPVPRGESRYEVLFYAERDWPDEGQGAGAPTLRKAMWTAAVRAVAARRAAEPARDEG